MLARDFVYAENDQVMTKEELIRAAPFDRRSRNTDTWLYRDGRWRVIAVHDYLVPSNR